MNRSVLARDPLLVEQMVMSLKKTMEHSNTLPTIIYLSTSSKSLQKSFERIKLFQYFYLFLCKFIWMKARMAEENSYC